MTLNITAVKWLMRKVVKGRAITYVAELQTLAIRTSAATLLIN